VGFFMLGNPGESEADRRRTHALMLELAPDIIQVAFYTPYPGSAAFRQELLAHRGLSGFSHYNVPSTGAEHGSPRILEGWQRRFYRDLILRTGFAFRYLRGEALPILCNLDAYLHFARLSARFLLPGARRAAAKGREKR
jgi:hypothetical protein